MVPLFADTSYYLALLNRSDAYHDRAVAMARQHSNRHIITTGFVVLELGNWLVKGHDRAVFSGFVSDLYGGEDISVISLTDDLLHRAMNLFRQRPDKSWSLTDCASFVVMKKRGLTDALTTDHHFAQAGFKALLL